MFDFDEPIKKPNGNFPKATEGPQSGEIKKVEPKTSKSGREYLSVMIVLDKGGAVFDAFYESDKDFVIYKMKKFLEALGVELSGKLGLKDIAKFIKVGTKLDVVVSIDDRGYAGIDFSGDNEGYYPFGFFKEIDDEPLPFDTDEADTSAPVAEEATTDIDDEDY